MSSGSATAMTAIHRNLPAYVQLVSMWVQSMFAYRVDLIFELLTLLLQIFLLKAVWVAVYAGRGSVGGIDQVDLIAFLTIANLQIWVMPRVIAGFLAERIREGQIALDLMRPVSFIEQLLVGEVGATAGFVPFVVAALPVAMLVGGLRPPVSVGAGGLYLLALAWASRGNGLRDLLLGLAAFWTTEIWGITTIYAFVNSFFAGALAPLWFFPPILRAIANVLPFQAVGFIPVAIYLGKLDGATLISAIALQALWVVLLSLLAQLVWQRAIRRVVVQGG